MSSNEEDNQEGESSQQGSKKRKIQRACDICRRKKIRCDGIQMPDNRCSNCITYRFECTYLEAARKRGPPKEYVEGLESRLGKMEKLLHKLCPDENLLKELDATLDFDTLPVEAEHSVSSTKPTELVTKVIRHSGSPVSTADNPDDEDLGFIQMSKHMKTLSLDPSQNRFFGQSSGAMLVQAAIQLKQQFVGKPDPMHPILGSRRPEFWAVRPWEDLSDYAENPSYTFPDDGLLDSLIDLYFGHANLILPLLHRPTFDRSVAAGLHIADSGFGAIVLLVCAIGSRYSDDPRVLLDGVPTHSSAGWKWFSQVQVIQKSFLKPPTLYDLQFYSLSVQFILGSSAPQQCWAMIGIGIRMGQDVGAHRRKYKADNMTVEDEMWKRAFWVLVCLDRMISSSFGRMCAIQDEDFDIDFPVECDDEYWDHPDPAQRFKQPPNKPSYTAAFVCYIKLLQILGVSLRTIYAINKSKVLLGFVGNQWEQHIVAELDSALNKWVDSIPHYLRWDPNLEDGRFFHQAAWLFCAYHYIQIVVHRPFILSVGEPSPLSFPSFAICINAARSCIHIIDVHSRRRLTPNQFHLAAFTSGIVLLLSIWGGKRSGLWTDPAKEMAEVYTCMKILKRSESRWHTAGRLWDMLYELAFVGDLPLPASTPPSSNKRERDADSPASTSTSDESSGPSLMPDGTRNIAGSRRVRDSKKQSASTVEWFQAQPLPHGQVAFSPPNRSPPSTSSFSYWGPTTSHDPTILGGSSGEPSTSYPQPNVADVSTSIDGLAFNTMGLNYTTFQEQFPPSSLGTISSNSGLHHTEVAPHPMSTPSVPYLATQQVAIDSDALAMWYNAPSGFDLDEWGTYLSNVSELTHGQPPP